MTHYGDKPAEFKVERISNTAIIRLRENITDISTEDGTQYEADEYTLEVPYSSTLENRISSDFENWLNRAKQADYDKSAAEVRAKRNELIAETDWTQVKDVPLTEIQIEAYAEYRQLLRDIPQQAGFPYTVVFPIKP